MMRRHYDVSFKSQRQQVVASGTPLLSIHLVTDDENVPQNTKQILKIYIHCVRKMLLFSNPCILSEGTFQVVSMIQIS